MVKMLSEISTDNGTMSPTLQENTDRQACSPASTSAPVLEIPPRTPPSNGCKTPATYGSYTLRQNQVSTVTLHGVQIVCLFIDGKERLCLAQISNTLLKSYSYNEIHNRRVALGITCVQCTPVQLEILRRAGAMPISSRRCGMITKREAERLVKSFLEDPLPPKLPENFCFEVQHDCGWGCQGNFEPSRYNSSRAKCIKCTYCNMYFSPNKFIFHFHRTPNAKYNHPDAANFNSWRRHLKLSSSSENDELLQMWEDVKAMFNGGSRKRIISQVSRSSHGPEAEQTKKSRFEYEEPDVAKPVYQSQYPPFPMLSFPGKPYQFGQLNHSPPFGIGFPFAKDGSIDASKGSHHTTNTAWGLQSILPTYNMFWNNPLNRQSRNGVNGSCYSFNEMKNHNDSEMYEHENDSVTSSPGSSPSRSENTERFSAFRLVGKNKSDKKSQIDNDNHDESEDESEEINIIDEYSDRDNISIRDENDVEHDETSKNSQNESENSKTGETDKKKECVKDEDKTHLSKKEENLDSEHETGEHESKFNNDNESEQKSENKTEERDVNENFSSKKETLRIPSTLNLCFNGTLSKKEDINEYTKEQLQEQLKQEIETRKFVERNIELMKESMNNELEKERQVRYSLQQKLKEAHDALHNFSCKMLASKQCDECTYKDENVSP